MKRTLVAIMMTSAAIAGLSAALAETIYTHEVFRPQDIKWGPGPAALPPGAQSALLFGDPELADRMFTMRIKAPKGYSIPPHTHPRSEVITVVSGKLGLGMGNTANRAEVDDMPTGSFFDNAGRRRPLCLHR